MKRKIWRVCVVGCGGMGAAHAEALRRNRRVRIVSCADLVGEKAKAFQAKYGTARWTADFQAECRARDVDILVVATLPSQHAAVATAGLRSGKHVLCEKPVSDSLAGARLMAEAAAASAGRILIGHQLRYEAPWPAVVKKLRAGLLGRPLVLRMCGNQMTFGATWSAQKRLIADTSPLVDCGVHYVDLMLAATGARPVSVYAQGVSLDPALPAACYNYGLLQVKFDDGSIGHYEAGWGPMMTKNAWYIKDFSGPKGSLSVIYELDQDTPDHPPTTATYRLRQTLIPTASCAWEEARITEEVLVHAVSKGDTLAAEHEFFLDALESGRDLGAPFQQACEALRVVLAADRSVKEERIVRLDKGENKCERARRPIRK